MWSRDFLLTKNKMSCAFRSIGYHVNLSSEEVRIRIVNELESGFMVGDQKMSDLIEIAESVNFDVYVRRMRSSSTWGGGPELAIASRLWDLSIEIRGPGTARMVVGQGRRHVSITYTGSHYEPVRGD